MPKKRHERDKRVFSTLRVLKTVLLGLLVIVSGYGIYQWTSFIEERQLQRELLEAQRILEHRRIFTEDPARALSAKDLYVSTFPLREPESYMGRTIPTIGESTTSVTNRTAAISDEEENIRVYEQFNRAVVNVTTESYRLNFFLEPVPESDTGSGTIIDNEGHVLTNYHVVDSADQVFITLYDGSVYEGRVKGTDRESDLAVVQFDPAGKELTTIEFADNPSLRVGQKVLAIGNPFGYDRTLTTGIISGLGRPIRTADNLILTDMIQTDASINPGNSGGPLLNAQGKLIGINTSIYSPTGGSIGLGFAVPMSKIEHVVPELIAHGRVVRGWLDITPVQLDTMIVDYASLPVTQGILISQVKSAGLAEQAGLRGGTEAVRYGSSIIYLGGDIIIEAAGQKIADYADLFSALDRKRPGDVVDIVVVRDRRMRSLQVELVQRPERHDW